jgi:hypothetical protein
MKCRTSRTLVAWLHLFIVLIVRISRIGQWLMWKRRTWWWTVSLSNSRKNERSVQKENYDFFHQNPIDDKEVLLFRMPGDSADAPAEHFVISDVLLRVLFSSSYCYCWCERNTKLQFPREIHTTTQSSEHLSSETRDIEQTNVVLAVVVAANVVLGECYEWIFGYVHERDRLVLRFLSSTHHSSIKVCVFHGESSVSSARSPWHLLLVAKVSIQQTASQYRLLQCPQQPIHSYRTFIFFGATLSTWEGLSPLNSNNNNSSTLSLRHFSH